MINRFNHHVMALIVYVLLGAVGFAQNTHAEDGYNLWLRYQALDTSYKEIISQKISCLYIPGTNTPTLDAAKQELQRGFKGFVGKPLNIATTLTPGCLVLAIDTQLAKLNLPVKILEGLGPEGYQIQTVNNKRGSYTVITASTYQGLLYGSFALLQHVQQHKPFSTLTQINTPNVKLRVLNHWDNLNRHVERGYAGQSIWDWWHLPDILSPRYTDYARANASVGINGTVLNNVNSKAASLTPRYIAKAQALANVFRPYGIKVYLSARFNAPMELGDLPTADPLNPKVQKWWQNKAKDIYAAIPDFGGFLVKANSEGQPGPQDYGRTHADGANMLAKALAPHGGVVMWRAFVYSEHNPEDRAKQAYDEFQPLDGAFAPNVLVQVKNGPIDFQPREPFHPLFGAMPKTPLMLELQLTKEYLGFATHLAYLGTLYEEVLTADTYRDGPNSTVASVTDGSLHNHTLTGVAGVANIGRDRNWSGSIFDQANWFAFARLAWNPNAKAQAIAKEWLTLTFNNNPAFIEPALKIMMQSREAVVNYMTPLGLTHQMATGHHYGPGPWVNELARPEWNPTYYNKANKQGIGFDRTKSGSNALSQYTPQVANAFKAVDKIEDEYLLWFHHVPWMHKTQSGLPLWHAFIHRYDVGIKTVRDIQNTWQGLKPFIDTERFEDTKARLNVQLKEAQWWRDASLAYFQSVNKLPFPKTVSPPPQNIEYYKDIEFPFAPGRGQ